ncbi:hypothetical protein DT070_06070 [Polaromonas sp. SP1]|nr:hypothetical protein DT070_06070 [Polaromonas sp. SP1]
MPPRLSVIGDLERQDHFFLVPEHRCYFWGEYTPFEHTGGQKWNFSPTNQLINNFKKKMDRVGQMDWRYKASAIERVATAFSQTMRWDQLGLQNPVLVPMPPSKRRNDPLYDPRMLDMLRSMAGRVQTPLNVQDILSFDGSCDASHEAVARPTPDELYAAMSVDTSAMAGQNPPGVILIFDDMLTTGAHFLAALRRLSEPFPGVPVIGVFVARRVIPNPFADFDDLDF